MIGRDNICVNADLPTLFALRSDNDGQTAFSVIFLLATNPEKIFFRSKETYTRPRKVFSFFLYLRLYSNVFFFSRLFIASIQVQTVNHMLVCRRRTNGLIFIFVLVACYTTTGRGIDNQYVSNGSTVSKKQRYTIT